MTAHERALDRHLRHAYSQRVGFFVGNFYSTGQDLHLEFTRPASHIIAPDIRYFSRTNMRTLFRSSEKRSAVSAVMMVLAVLVMGAITKSEGASHLDQMIRIDDTNGGRPLVK